jgi:hypothetical protein
MRIAALCIVLAALPATAMAQDLSLFEKMELKQACGKDIETLCGAVERGDGRMLQCIRQSAEKLSQPCHDAIAKLRGNLLAAAADEPMDY